MIELDRVRARALRNWFADERPGVSALAAHVRATGWGRWWVDRWPEPRLVAVQCADNFLLRGDADAVPGDDLTALVAGYVAAPPAFGRVLGGHARRLVLWDRQVRVLPAGAPLEPPRSVGHTTVRRLTDADAAALGDLSTDLAWIWKTWGDGPAALAASGYAWGAFRGPALTSVACTFLRGDRFEDVGVVTEPAHRGRGLSTACVRGLCADIRARGRVPSWTTTPDNAGSRAVAHRVGFVPDHLDVLYLVDVDIAG